MKSYVRTISSTIRHAYLMGLKSMPSSSNFVRYATTNFDIKFQCARKFPLCLPVYNTSSYAVQCYQRHENKLLKVCSKEISCKSFDLNIRLCLNPII